jgi:LacI family transcriptional regulator
MPTRPSPKSKTAVKKAVVKKADAIKAELSRTVSKNTLRVKATRAGALSKKLTSEPSAAGELSRTANIMDVARLAGVSKKTVSRVINDSELVHVETRTKVQSAIAALGYSPDPQARGLSSRYAYLIGMIFDNPTAQYIVSMQYGILDALRDSGFELVVHPCDSKQANYAESVKRFVKQQRLYGVILIPRVSEDEALAQAIRELGVEYIRIAAVELDQPERMIVTNDRRAGRDVARYFESLGHKRIALINGPSRYRSALERGAGFREGLLERGLTLPNDHVYEGGYTFESGVAGAQLLLALTPRPTAIFATNDQMAAGVYKAAQRMGLKIPEQLSVVGYDDSPLAVQLWPALTSCHIPVRMLGQSAAKALLGRRQGKLGFSGTSIEPNLVIRESSQPPER